MIKLLGLHIHWTTYLKYVKLSHSSLQAMGTGITTMNSSSETNFSELMTNSGCCLVGIMSHNHRILHMADLVSNVAKVSLTVETSLLTKKAIKKSSQMTGLVGLTVIGKTGFEPATPTSRT